MGLALFYILAFISEIIGTIGGFGSSIFLIPLGGFFFDFQTVLAVTAVIHMFSNVSKLVLFWEGINWRLLLLIGLPATIFVLLGSWLSTIIYLKYAEIVLGIFLIVFSLFFFWKPEFKIESTKPNAILGGSVSGFLAGIIGTGGAIRGLSLAAFNLEKNTFIATSAAIDFFVDASRSVVYLSNGYLEKEYYTSIPFLIAVAVLGSYTGKLILKHISGTQFKKIVLSFILIIGIIMVWKTLAQ
ncbi:MAG: sulfite exporter TauE/SafE family protein [Bacteroidia bacterium]|nr:sulfite exporter TauE/SafE family protein [Bacteroidia bacterium]